MVGKDKDDKDKDEVKDDGKRNIGDDKYPGKEPGDIDPKKYGKN